jgi:uncharacterized protein (TIGR03067 family)
MAPKLLALAAVLLVAAPVPKGDPVTEELKKFQGRWKLTAAEFNGQPADPEHVKTAGMVIEGDQFTMRIGNETQKGKFTVDPGKKPRTIDVEFTEGMLAGTKVRGIYEIEGDTRKSCFTEPGNDRPTDFTGGQRKYVWVWKRDKP